jgi:hypothetical protein
MPIAQVTSLRVAQVGRSVYAVSTGPHVLVIERAKFVLRRGGRFVGQWLKYLTGKLSTTGEKIMVCLGAALRDDIAAWVHSSNGSDMLFLYRMFESMVKRLGLAKCLAIMLLSTK